MPIYIPRYSRIYRWKLHLKFCKWARLTLPYPVNSDEAHLNVGLLNRPTVDQEIITIGYILTLAYTLQCLLFRSVSSRVLLQNLPGCGMVCRYPFSSNDPDSPSSVRRRRS